VAVEELGVVEGEGTIDGAGDLEPPVLPRSAGRSTSGCGRRSRRADEAARAISARIAIIASQKRSSSALDSLSVGSIISVPGTGNDIVGAWKP
jgi:hypothetical protein